MIKKLVGWQKIDKAEILAFLAVSIEKNNGRDSLDSILFQELFIV